MDSPADDLTVLVDRLRRDRRTHPYQGRREYVQAARDLTDACVTLIEVGQAAAAMPLLRKAVDRMTSALMYMDDSSGVAGDALRKIMEVYAKACAAAPPESKRLAGWLVKLECDGPGWPEVRLRHFAPALGERGLAEVERLVAERADTTDPESWTGVFAIRDLREQLAEVSGDVDRYVEVLAEHLESTEQYIRIVAALRAAGRPAEAVDWARRGLTAKTGRPKADKLRDTLVDLLLEQGDTDAALAVHRAEFERHPTLASYRSWAGTATRTDTPEPTATALDRLRQRSTEQPVYLTELIDVLASTGAHDEAWTLAAADPSRLGRSRWLTMLAQRGAAHPADVIAPYQHLIDEQVDDSTDKYRYRRAVPLLAALREAYRAAAQEDLFPAYLTDFRTRNRRRPTLLKTLDNAGFQA